MLFMWGCCSNSLQQFGKCDLGFRFADVNLKVDMLVEWDAFVYNFVQIWYVDGIKWSTMNKILILWYSWEYKYICRNL